MLVVGGKELIANNLVNMTHNSGGICLHAPQRIDEFIPAYRIKSFQKARGPNKIRTSPLNSDIQGMGRMKSSWSGHKQVHGGTICEIWRECRTAFMTDWVINWLIWRGVSGILSYFYECIENVFCLSSWIFCNIVKVNWFQKVYWQSFNGVIKLVEKITDVINSGFQPTLVALSEWFQKNLE